MSGFVQALRAYREGTLSKEKLLTEVERQIAMRETDAVALMRLLNAEHARSHLPIGLHGALATRIMSSCAPQASRPLADPDPTHSAPSPDRTDTVFIDHRAASSPGDAGSVAPSEVENHRCAPITLGS